MEEVMVTGTYLEFKKSLDQDVWQQAEGFVRIGYKLKIARDTGILAESGYKSVTEFAQKEYGFRPDQVSRFIDINDRYSVGGYSETLEMKYQGYGYTKLAEMLTLPDGVVDALDPSVTREEIRNVKAEIQEEQKISDLEVLMEEQQEEQKEMNLEQKAMHQYFYDYREHFVELADVLESQQENDGDAEKVMDVIAPSGIAVVFVRIRGIGKLMLSFRGENENIIIQNVRTMEKRELSWTGFLYTIKSLYEKEDLSDPKAAWERIYGEPYAEEKEPIPEKTEPVKAAKKEKIAPAQKSAPHKVNTESNTDHREAEKPVQTEGEKALEEAPIEPEQTEPVEQGQIEGQDNIMNHPEYLPEGMARTEASVDGQPVPAEVEPTAGQRKEECLAEISMIQGNIEIGKYGAALQVAKKLVENLEILA